MYENIKKSLFMKRTFVIIFLSFFCYITYAQPENGNPTNEEGKKLAIEGLKYYNGRVVAKNVQTAASAFRGSGTAALPGILIYAVLNILISSYFVYRFVGITLQKQWKEVGQVALNALIPIFVCFLIGFLVDQLYLRFALSFISYFAIYTLLAWLEKDKAIDFFKGYFNR